MRLSPLIQGGVLAALLAGSGLAAPQNSPTNSTVVAVVNGQDLTLGTFNQDFDAFAGRILNQQGLPFSAQAVVPLESYRPQVLQQIAQELVILQAAAAAGVQASTAKVDRELAKVRSQFKTNTAFLSALAQTGIQSEAVYRTLIRDGMIYSTYSKDLIKQFTFPNSVVKLYYQTNQSQFTKPATACVRHILVKTDALAEKIKAMLLKGASFSALAKKSSIDPGSKNKGGNLGCIAPGTTVPPFNQAAFSGPVGKYQIVHSQYGYHVLLVTKRTAASVEPLSQAKAAILKALSNQALQSYFNHLTKKAKIVTYPKLVTVASPTPVAPPTQTPSAGTNTSKP